MADTIRMLLPVGSVVRLAGSDALVMVMGFEPDFDGVQADYLGVPCPMGLVSDDAALVFDADAVDEVVQRGFWDEEAEAGVATVRRYRAAADDFVRQVYELIDNLTPQYVAKWRALRAFDELDDEPEPDFSELEDEFDPAFEEAWEEPEPDFPDEG